MAGRHPLLLRQLKACYGADAAVPAGLEPLLNAVDAAYGQADTDRDLIERALELSSQELLHANSDMRAVLHAFPGLFLWLEKDGAITACRGQAVEDLVLPVGRLIGRRIQSVPDPAVAAKLEAAVAAVRGGTKLVRTEYDLEVGGETRHFEARLLPLFDGQLAIIQNVSDRKASEHTLARSVSMLEATLEATDDGILVVDLQGVMVRFNRRFVEMWRIPPEVVRTRSDEAALRFVLDQLSEPERFLAKVRELYEQPEAESFDELHFKDGRIFERYSKPQTVQGKAVGRVWSFRDVTARRHADRALHRSEEQLRQAQKMEAIGRLAGGVAHDFNNLLTAIIGFGELLLGAMESVHPFRHKVEQMTVAATRGAALTQQLLAFSRQQMTSARPVEIGAVLDRLAPILQRLIGEDIELTRTGGPVLGTVLADPIQIEQVLLNLAINARDAMPHGGKLRIESARIELDEPRIGEHPGATAGPYVMIAVTDNGLGMTPEVQARAFEPFFTTKDVGQGTGMGLATVYGIVQQHAGFLELQSEVGKGTCLRVFLPLVTLAGEPDLDEPARASGPAAEGETVLLVEDDDTVRSLAREILEGGGYRILEACNGAEALKIAEERDGRFELVLTDVVMPECGGRELSERILRAWPDTRILFMSGYTNDAILRHGVLDESLPFMPKPFSPDELLLKVREVLRGAEADPPAGEAPGLAPPGAAAAAG